jgi:hypothetical protein
MNMNSSAQYNLPQQLINDEQNKRGARGNIMGFHKNKE